MSKSIAFIFLVTLIALVAGGIYCDYDLLGYESCWSTLDAPDHMASSKTGVRHPELAGQSDYPRDGGTRFKNGMRSIYLWYVRAVEEAGATDEQLHAWADCLYANMGKVTDAGEACERSVRSFLVQHDDFAPPDGVDIGNMDAYTASVYALNKWYLKVAKDMGATDTQLMEWRQCLHANIGMVTDENEACQRAVKTFIVLRKDAD